jgi:hypothetical protein
MPRIEWKHKAENPGPYDTVYGHVDGADRPRFDVGYDGASKKWVAIDLDSRAPGYKNVPESFTGKYVECVDWCWQRLPAHESPTGGQS